MIPRPFSTVAGARGGRLDRLGRIALAALVVLACLRFVYALQGGPGGNRGDFFHTMPGPIVETMNKPLWERPEFTNTLYPKHTYLYGPTQYLTIVPFLFVDSYEALAAALLWLYIPLTCGAAIFLWKMAGVLSPAASGRTALAVIVAAMGLFFPLLHAFAGREFEVVCFGIAAAAAYFLVTGRPAVSAGLLAYVAWFKIWPVVFAVHLAAKRRYQSLAVFCVVSAGVMLAADVLFGLEYFSIFAFIRDVGPAFFSGVSSGTGFCSARNGVSLAAGFCAAAQFAPGLSPRLALIATLGGIAIGAGLTFIALERATLSKESRSWREFLEFSLILTVVLTFIRTEYYYFTFLFIPLVGLGARYFATDSQTGLAPRALLVLTYGVLSAFVVPVFVVSRLTGTDFWAVYTKRGLYLAGELGLLSLLLAEYLRLGWKATRATAPRAADQTPAHASMPVSHHGWRSSTAWVGITIAAIAIITTRTWAGGIAHDLTSGRRTAVTIETPAGSLGVDTQAPVVSPDGSSVAMIVRRPDGSATLWIQPIAGGVGNAVPGTAGAEQPFWAPDGSSVAFFANGSLNIADLAGETVRVVAPAPNPRGGTWSRGGTLLFAPGDNGPVMAVRAEGDLLRAVTTLANDLGHRWPRFLPDDVHFTYTGLDADAVEWTHVGSLAVTEKIQLNIVGAVYGDREIVSSRRGQLLGTPFDPKTLIAERWPVRLSGFLPPTSGAGRSYAVSSGGTISFWNPLSLTKVSRDGTLLAEYDVEDVLLHPRVSPDGKYVAVNANSIVFILLADTFRLVRTVRARGPVSAAVWSPDSRSLAFSVDVGPRAHINVVSLDTDQEFQLLDNPAGTLVPGDWARDGYLIIEVNDPNTGAFEICRAAVRPDAVLEPLGSGQGPRLSPDGEWLAFMPTGTNHVSVARYPNLARHWIVTTTGTGEAPVWNGRELIYKHGRSIVRGIPLMTDAGIVELSARETLFEGSYLAQYDVADAGKSFIMVALAPHPDKVQIFDRTPPASAHADPTLPLSRAR